MEKPVHNCPGTMACLDSRRVVRGARGGPHSRPSCQKWAQGDYMVGGLPCPPTLALGGESRDISSREEIVESDSLRAKLGEEGTLCSGQAFVEFRRFVPLRLVDRRRPRFSHKPTTGVSSNSTSAS